MNLSKITAHDQNEATSKRNSTIFTIRSACMNRLMIERSWAIVPPSET